MKRAGQLWAELTSWANLLDSALLAARGKRARPDVARFLGALETNLLALQRELTQGTYQPGPYRHFWISDPKPRLISAAPFRDRVVHHAVTRTLEPVFEPRFTPSCFASRRGYGQHRALRLATEAVAAYPWVLKADIRKYFPSIDQGILLDLVGRAVKCPRTMALVSTIVSAAGADAGGSDEPAATYFPGDDLFTPFERRRGLPIGNQTSQFLANVYLNPLDQYVRRHLRPALYLRYVDDFVLFATEASELETMRGSIVDFLARLRLLLNDRKSRVMPCREGLTFLGWRLSPGQARLPRPHVVRVRRRFRALAAHYHSGELSWQDLNARVQAWLGHACFGDTFALRQNILDSCILVPAAHGRNCAARGLVEQQFNERPRLEPQQERASEPEQ